MSEFTNVTVVKKANVYFEAKVVSRTIKFADGSTKTLGFMLPGEYEFGTNAPEIMEIMSGELEVLLPGQTVWKKIKGGESFEVTGSSKFKVKIIKGTDYCCSFV
ncbi:MAG: pyrimidine/purine nucleoside phosphorylase [Candidatus Omnitrophica bacterium]|nr:pyrimidine/purine nucleoside phosphorylase [Candidatus Omnitrophota bacterium]